MRRTKANRALTFVMAAALLIGSIHGVGAKEQSKAYEAPELTLVQGASDYDLTEGITYDSEKYTLSVTDTGNFDINVAGDYEISYALTEKESSVSETESVENTESADIIESTETVSGTETVDTTETIENTDQTPEGDDQTSGTDTADQDKPDQPADKDEADSAKDPTDSGNAGQLQGTSTGVGEAQESENQDDGNTDTVKEESADTDTVNITEEQTPKAANATQEVINFSRTVKVVAAEEPVETYAANYRVASYANVQGNYTVNLGTPVWTDETHKKFQYTNAKIDTGSDDISLMTITLSNGKLPDDILNNATVRDDYGRSATWIFMDKKSSQEIEKKIQTMTFDYVSDMNVYVSVNANDNEGFESGLDQMKLTQWSVSGHYYLHVNEKVSWTSAYDRAKTYKLAGQRGYLATITSNDELSYILTLQKGQTWTAGTRLIMKDGSSLNDTPFGRITNGIVKYGQDYYWAAGPETGEKIESLWGSGEPNRASVTYGALNGTISDVQGQESCVMVRNTDIKTLNDIIEGNVPGDTDITSGGFFVEFGGYADGADPGQPDPSPNAGKIAETSLWQLPLLPDSENATELQKGKIYSVRFSDGQNFRMTLSSVSVDYSLGKTLLVFSSRETPEKVLNLCTEVTVVAETYKGLFVPAAAVRRAKTEEGQVTGVYTQRGNKIFFKKITILSYKDGYFLAKEYTSETPDYKSYLALNDQIITGGKGVTEGYAP